MDDIVLTLQADKIRENIRQNRRDDGRGLTDFRPLFIERNISKNAEASVRLKLGHTEVYAGIKILPGDPFPDSPGQGSISVGVEMLQMAAPEIESGPPSPLSIEMSRVVDRGIRESHAIDFARLAIPGTEKVWVVFVDLYPVNDDGNLFDACGLAALAALDGAKLPKFADGAIVPKEFDGKISLARKPVLVTGYKIGNRIVFDVTRAEEKAATARFSVATTEDSYYSAFQKGLGDSLTAEEVEHTMDMAMQKGGELRKQLFEGPQ